MATGHTCSPGAIGDFARRLAHLAVIAVRILFAEYFIRADPRTRAGETKGQLATAARAAVLVRVATGHTYFIGVASRASRFTYLAPAAIGVLPARQDFIDNTRIPLLHGQGSAPHVELGLA